MDRPYHSENPVRGQMQAVMEVLSRAVSLLFFHPIQVAVDKNPDYVVPRNSFPSHSFHDRTINRNHELFTKITVDGPVVE